MGMPVARSLVQMTIHLRSGCRYRRRPPAVRSPGLTTRPARSEYRRGGTLTPVRRAASAIVTPSGGTAEWRSLRLAAPGAEGGLTSSTL